MARKPMIGDIVHVSGKVREVFADSSITVDIDGTKVSARQTDIVHVERAPLKVGDEAIAIHTGHLVKILAIDGNEAWVRLNVNGGRITVTFDNLRRGLPCTDEPRPLKVGDKVRNTKDGYDVGYIDRFWNNAHGVPMAAVSPTHQSFPVAYLERAFNF